ncbi:MAG: hypothetical protein WCK78_02885 [Paludibacter sp.]
MNVPKLLGKINNYPQKSFFLVFLGLVLYQLVLIFQSFELCDTGYYATCYQNILRNPSSVVFNFGYWFTGIVGGVFVELFPESGLLGIRFLGVLNTSATIYIVYKLLNGYLNNIALYLGLILVTTSFVITPTEFYHNPFSSFLFVYASYLLFQGINKNKLILIVFCAILLALNAFARLPNILDIALILIFPIHAFYYKESKIIWIKRSLVLLFSFLISIISILGIMKIIGHYDLFIENILELKSEAGGSGSYNLFTLINRNINAYIHVFSTGLLITVFLLILSYISQMLNNFKIKNFLLVFILLIALYFMIRFISRIELLYYFSLISLFWNIYSKENEIKILSWIGLFMLILMPIGSDDSIYMLGYYSIWIAVPLVVNLFITEKFGVAIKIESLVPKNNYHFKLDNHSIKLVLVMFLVVFIGKNIVDVSHTSHFESRSRIHRTFSINNPRTKYIYTTNERAKIVNDLLDGIKPYIKEGDEIITYESIPMIFYLTKTKPYLGSPWLIAMSGSSLSNKIERVKKIKKTLPLVIRQKFPTIGGFGIPSDQFLSSTKNGNLYFSQEQIRVFNNFLIENKYKIIWQNTYFNLYAPQN